MYYVYVLRSLKNKKRYVGYTSKSPQSWMKEHNAGSNQYTKANRPFELIHYEAYEGEIFAMKRERFLKSGNGRKVLDKTLDKLGPCSSVGQSISLLILSIVYF